MARSHRSIDPRKSGKVDKRIDRQTRRKSVQVLSRSFLKLEVQDMNAQTRNGDLDIFRTFFAIIYSVILGASFLPFVKSFRVSPFPLIAVFILIWFYVVLEWFIGDYYYQLSPYPTPFSKSFLVHICALLTLAIGFTMSVTNTHEDSTMILRLPSFWFAVYCGFTILWNFLFGRMLRPRIEKAFEKASEKLEEKIKEEKDSDRKNQLSKESGTLEEKKRSWPKLRRLIISNLIVSQVAFFFFYLIFCFVLRDWWWVILCAYVPVNYIYDFSVQEDFQDYVEIVREYL